MIRKTRKAAILAALLILTVAAAGCTTYSNFKNAFFADGDSGDKIVIGVLEPQSGEYSDKGKAEIEGIELAHEIRPDVLGKDIELIYGDTQSSVYVTESVVKDMVGKEPDVVLVQDKTLLDSVDVFGGLHDNGYVLINSSATPEEMGLKQLVDRLPAGHVLTVPATRFALEKIGRPLPGAAMLAGFAAMTGGLKLESVQQAYLARYVGKVGEANAAVAELAYRHLQQLLAQ